MGLGIDVLLDGVMRTLREAVLPAVEGRFARGQLFATMEGATTQVRSGTATAGIAQGLRELALRAAFPDDGTGSRLRRSLEIELTALANGRYGDLLAGNADVTSAVRPRLSATAWTM